jgi:hypothetical protein
MTHGSRKTENKGDQPVGYCRPPVASRFPKGTSGNAKGRPRKPKVADASSYTAFNQLFVEEMTRDIPQANGEPMSLVRRLVRHQALEAAKTGGNAIAPVLKQTAESLKALAAERNSLLEVAINYKYDMEKVFYEYRRRGEKEPPDIIPHPDHISITSDGAGINGPIDREGRRHWEFIKHAIRNTVLEIENIKANLSEDPDDGSLRESLEFHMKIRRSWMRKVPKGWNWKERIWSLDSNIDDFYILGCETSGEEVSQDLLRSLIKFRGGVPAANGK